MKTQKVLFLITSISSLLFSCGTSSESSQKQADSSAAGSVSESSAATTSSAKKFENLDHVMLFVSKETNQNEYKYVYAYKDNQPIIGNWPGALLTSYDSDWLVYEFDKKYTSFSVIFTVGSSGPQNSVDGLPINGIGPYWYYNDTLQESDTMPNLNPGEDIPDVPDTPDTPSTGNVENGNIFHAFDWSLNAIKNKIDDIAAAGYTAVQTSPLQKPKDYWDGSTNSDWWKLYQPWSFDVPSSGTYLGTRNDLKALTAAAHKKNVKVIVDVVANHVGGNGDNPDGGVMDEIKNNASSTLRHEGQCFDWNDRYKVTHWRIGGYPELNSANTSVQNIVYKYLTQLIDDGVDGFRFDAAKHIETPYDADNIKSDFWTNTAVKARAYAKKKNIDLYMYGEILDNLGGNAKYEYYTTDLLDAITDNTTGNNVLSAVENGNSNGAAKKYYNTNLDAKNLVVWGESHDTYMNKDGSSKNSDQKNVDKAYALMGSRKGSRGLYFARPSWGAKLGSGETQNQNYKNKFITAVNNFKNDMGSNNETVASDGSIAYVARHGSNGYGATIVNVSGSGKVTLTFQDLENGTYRDLLTNTTYTMANHSITVTIDSTYGATVIEKVS